MKSFSISLLLLALPSLSLATVPPIPRAIDVDGPTQGVQPLELQEVWRVGGEDEEVIFGRIVDLSRHPDGTTYILDNQMCQVVVVSPEGEFLTNLSREGDGPGELRQPIGLVFLEDDVIGIGTGFPGKLVSFGTDGTPMGNHYPIGEPSEGNIGIMMSVKNVDGLLMASGGRMVFADQDKSHTERFLAVSNDELDGYTRILETTTPLDPTGIKYVEADNYYIDYRWDLGPAGTIFAAMERDAYEISVFDRTGNLLRVFGREEKQRKRTQNEKDQVGPLINMGGERQDRDWKIADHDGSIGRVLYDHEDQTVWVLTANGSNDQPDGILETWDVFSTEGEYLRRVPIPLGDEMNDGALYLVGDGHLVVVKGAGSNFSDEEEEDTEAETLEVICYKIK